MSFFISVLLLNIYSYRLRISLTPVHFFHFSPEPPTHSALHTKIGADFRVFQPTFMDAAMSEMTQKTGAKKEKSYYRANLAQAGLI